jgi:hypothetical protein
MDEQKHLIDVSDPSNYRKMCEPMSQADAEKACAAFFREFYELRNKYGIADAYVIIKMFVKDNTDGEKEGEIITSMHAGSELNREGMVAWAHGLEQSERQQRILALMSRHPSVKGPVHKK